MLTTAHHGFVLASAAVGLALALLALWRSGASWLRYRNPVDVALSVAALMWLSHLVVSTAVIYVGSPQQAAYVTHVGLQLLLISVGFFLLTVAGMITTEIYLLLAVQAVVGSAALYWSHWGGSAQAQAHQIWIATNLWSGILLTLAVAHRVYVNRSYKCWLALAGSIVGFGISIDHVFLAPEAEVIATLWRLFYAAFLLVVWHLVVHRVGPSNPQYIPSTDSQNSTGFESNTGFESITGFWHDQEVAASAVAIERRRIAQDLHDGVASQIVSILSSLDSHTPQQQAVALALEQCLLDLKMAVDAIDSVDDNVIEALGSLRYRVQHSLDKLGIRMAWKVEICDELEAVRGVQAQQVLRIAQECLSNVMRHANASAVKVICRFVPETKSLLMEVRDNGQGITTSKDGGRGAGKGLKGMRRRAQAMGGELVISSKAGAGTRVRLSLPATANASATLMGHRGTGWGH